MDGETDNFIGLLRKKTSGINHSVCARGEDSVHNILGLAHEVNRPLQQAAAQLPAALQSKEGSIVTAHKVLLDTPKHLTEMKAGMDVAFKR
eukprot:7719426-Pyramimonas_sp.AAC.2